MLESEKEALRALLLTICDRSNQTAAGILNPRVILAEVVCETQSILADIAYSLNEQRTCCRLPCEVLGKCLSYLPFPFRMGASRTSRAWRAAALCTPSLWADISEEYSSPQLTVPAFSLALSRSAAVPLSLEFTRELDGDILKLVRMSMHRVVHLQLSRVADSTLLEQPAPLLHTLRLDDVTTLTTEFLSGRQGRLAIIKAEHIRFPTSCPGLYTLTTLIVGRCDAVALGNIFTICPRLKKLEITNATARNVEALGRPPTSLTDLTLGTMENRAQLLPVFSAYRTAPDLARTELRYGCTSNHECYSYGCDADDLAVALHGVVSLRIDLAFPTLYIEASYQSGSSLRLSLEHMFMDDWHTGFLPVFKQHVDCFTKLRTLTMPIFALEAFVAEAPPLPALSELTVTISKGPGSFRGGVARETGDNRVYPWHLLRFLAGVTQRRIDLEVRPFPRWNRPPILPTADDAQALVAELANIARPCEVRVLGFAPDTVPAARDLTPGLDLVFNV